MLICDYCGKERLVRYQTNHLDKPEHPCKQCFLKEVVPNKRDNTYQKKRNRKATKSEYLNYHGYIVVNMGDEGYRLKHHLVMEENLGRKLNKSEVIHHINGDKTDNRLENLYLCSSMSQHRDIHKQLESVSFDLVQKGLIKFDHGTYSMPVPLKNGETLSPKGYGDTVPSLSNEKGVTTIPQGSKTQESLKKEGN